MQDQPTNAEQLGAAAAQNRTGTECPRIYVACLAAYNAGELHGRSTITRDLRARRFPNMTGSVRFGELAGFIAERGKLGAKLLEYFGQDLDEAKAAFDDYAGEHQSLADFAEDLTREIGPEIPDALRFYIDWTAMSRDLELSGDVFTVEVGFEEIHIFWSR